MTGPEAQARENIDKQLEACGWTVQDRKEADVSTASGLAIREFPLKGGDEVDYMLYADRSSDGPVVQRFGKREHARITAPVTAP